MLAPDGSIEKKKHLRAMKSYYDDFMIITKYIMILTPYKRPYL